MANFTDKFRMKTRGLSPEQLADFYSSWADEMGYDKDMAECKSRAPSILVDELAACFPKSRPEIKIMDIACGTGRVGEQLLPYGFTNIDGLDSSTGMLSQCRKKGHYNKLYQMIINGENTIPVADDTFDCLLVAGGVGENHIPCSGILEMKRIVKPGGLILIVMRKEYEDSVGEDVDEMDMLISMLQRMLSQCRKKDHYNKLYQMIINGENTIPVPDDTHDCLVVAGGVGGNHIPCSGILEMIRIVKPGGLILIVMKKEYEDSVGEDVDEMDELISMLECKVLAELVDRREVSKYFVDRDGILFKIRTK